MSDNIRVLGYVEKVVYNGNIEYRNFSPDLVGLQLASDGGTPLFTMGNFNITTNMDPQLTKNFVTSEFSQFYSLTGLSSTAQQTQAIINNITGTTLNLDKTKLKNYALFGSLTEFVRVSLEDIITTWPASLYVTPFYVDSIGTSHVADTFENYAYDVVSDVSSFRVNNTLISNKFNINYLINGNLADSFNASNDLRNLTVNYAAYVIPINNVEYNVVGFTGSTDLTNDYLYFQVKGNVFLGQSSILQYHIRPSNLLVDTFFQTLDAFQSYLLNRQSYPLYTATFKYAKRSESGIIIYTQKSVTWPVSDGYNIDFDTGDYISYATELLTISIDSDSTETNLIVRFFVSESITSFDTIPVHFDENLSDDTGGKVTKLLTLYGREFDEINNFIQGLSYAHSVSYDKVDNTPDKYLKDLARVLGWDLISSVTENDLLTNYVSTQPSEYSGQSRSLTPVEADIELWRRLILNSPWLWKSKGARKSIEFLLKFIGSPKGLVEFNEYIYRADAPINVEVFSTILFLSGLDNDLANYPMDNEGYPRFFPENNDMYFQADGKWYRETGGSASTIDILVGNNPHVGPYDGGYKYINQLSVLIPNFTGVTITGETIVSGVTNLFTNYNSGRITNYSGETYVSATTMQGADLPTCVSVVTEIVQDPKKTDLTNECGCPSGLSDDSLKITINKAEIEPAAVIQPKAPCYNVKSTQLSSSGYIVFEKYQYNQDGTPFKINGQEVYESTPFTESECCTSMGGFANYTDEYYYINNTKDKVISGYICCVGNGICELKTTCNWYLNTTRAIIKVNGVNEAFCEFTTLYGDGIKKVTTATGYFCPKDWTIPISNITDPYTGEVGVGCKLTQYGATNYKALGVAFKNRADSFNCNQVDFPIKLGATISYGLLNEIVGYDNVYSYAPINVFITDDTACDAKTKMADRNALYSDLSVRPSIAPIAQGPTSYTYEAIKVGTVFYLSQQPDSVYHYTLNGYYVIEVNTVTSTRNTGLILGHSYLVKINQGTITELIDFVNLSSC